MTTYGPLRIGDAERDAAAAALSEHYASGRLTKPEYDERLEAIWAARFDADLRPIFADLPGGAGGPEPRLSQPTGRPSPAGRQGPWAARQGPRSGRPGSWAGREGLPPWRYVASGARLFWLAPLALIGLVGMAVIALHVTPFILLAALFFFVCGGGRNRHYARRRYYQTRWPSAAGPGGRF